MKDNNFDSLNVYKIFNFSNGEKIIQTIQNDKTLSETIDYFDSQWNLLELKQNFPNSKNPLRKPKELNKMLELASVLSDGFPFLRTDFYIINEKIYFSEITFYSDSGFARFNPPEWDQTFGEWIDLTNNQY
jgi:hypothetical protein